MNSDDKLLIVESWGKVAAIADVAIPLFYRRLFELDPELQRLFRNADMTRQHRSLAETLSALVDALENLELILPNLRELGAKHSGYGVSLKDYDTVGAALLWTLEQGLGDGWNENLARAWGDLYSLVSLAMKSGASDHRQSEFHHQRKIA